MISTTVFPILFSWSLGCFALALNAYFLAFTLSALPFVPAVTDSTSSTCCDSMPRRGFVLTVASLLFVVFLIVFHTVLIRSLLIAWSITIVTATLAYLAPGEVLITPRGLLRAHPLRGNILLPWRNLDHYEVRKGVTNTIYFRTHSGQTICVNNWTQSAPSLLQQIQPLTPLSEQPYHAHHWYGG
jgi:hypothetical protein